MPSAGHVLAGRYRLERPLGAGSMGTVWAAVHLELDAPVAIKLEHPTAQIATRTEASRREARAAARLRSPHVVQTFDFGTDGGLAFIAMELLAGESLRARLHAHRQLSPNDACEIVRQAARALDLAHRERIVHRDIKPSNLFLVREEGREIVKVLDFGVAKWLDAEAGAEPRTDSMRLVGSAAYMSPEQARGRAVDHRSDIWALSVVAYEMLLGARPYPGSNIPETLGRICAGIYPTPSERGGRSAAELDIVFARGLHLDPERRFQSAGELARALGEVVGRLPSPATVLELTSKEDAEEGFGRDAETASLHVVVSSGHDARRTRTKTLAAILVGTSLAAGVIAISARSLVSVGNERRLPLRVEELSDGAQAPSFSAGAGATSSPSARVFPSNVAGNTSDVEGSAMPAELATPAELAKPATSVRRATASASAGPRNEPSARPAAKSAPAPPRIDPLFGLELPAP